MGEPINIRGLDAAEILARLYNEACPLGMGWLQARAEPMTREEALKLLQGPYFMNRASFDYVYGRPLKVDFVVDEEGQFIELWGAALYDRDQGQGHCQRIIGAVRGAA